MRTTAVGAMGLVLIAGACGGSVDRESPGGGGGAGGGTSFGGSGTGATGGGIPTGGTGAFGGSGAIGGGTGAFGGSGAIGGGGSPSGGFSGIGGFAGSPPSNDLGTACNTGGSCSDYLSCVGPLTLGGGPAKGLCSYECGQDPDPNVCDKLVPGAKCVKIGNSSYCVQSCTLGPYASTQFDPGKCRGRQEMACTKVGNGAVCLPNCNGDFDCPNGTVCNPKTGLCQVGDPGGAPTGGACTVDTECHGSCLPPSTSGGTGMCADACTLGALPACGWGGPGTGPAPAYCLFSTASNEGAGDLGRCARLCDCDTDCGSTSLDCTPFKDQVLAGYVQRKGFCVEAGTSPNLPCP